MKLTLSWLKEYLNTSASLEDISRQLTALGLEVDGIEDPAKTLEGFVVGHVVTAEKHPDADKLQCLTVDTGTEKLAVVCGAPNAKAGMKGVFAPAGSYVPGIDLTLKKTKIRGAESNGMMCSEKELLLSDEHKGIIELDAACETGSPAAAALGLDDPIIEIGLTPNRGDCAGVLGVARDLSAAGMGALIALPSDPVKSSFDNPVSVKIEDEAACPYFIGRYIRGVKNGAAGGCIEKRLNAMGARPISALVDVTNYMCLGMARPLHVFDADKLKGNLVVRLSKKGEMLEALDDNTYTLEDGMTVICDDSGVIALAGVVGGVSTSVDENTKNVYLEVAYFDPVRTARTGQKLQINSDARYRFERGIDPAFMPQATEIATQMIIDLCGGEVSTLEVAGTQPDITREISYSPGLVKTLGGHDVAPEKQKEILTALGFAVNDIGAAWSVKTPSWRHDVEGAADIVEEVLRVDGYDNIPAVFVTKEPGASRPQPTAEVKNASAARHVLASRGLLETVTWSFMDSAKSDLFGANDTQQKKALTLANPISADLAVMRPSVLANLIDAAGRNTDRALPDAALFEIGNIYKFTTAEGQIATATGLRSGYAVPRHWSGAARKVDVVDAKADAFAVLEACGFNPESVQITTDAPEWYHPGRSGVLRLGKNVLAYFGEIHPGVSGALKRDEALAGFEVFLGNIPQPKKKSPQKPLLKPSPFQPVSRDFAFIVDLDVPADKLVRAVKAADKALIASVDIFDVYTGKGVPEDKKSLAIGVTLQPVDKTLTDEEIAAISKKIVESVQKQTGGALRG